MIYNTDASMESSCNGKTRPLEKYIFLEAETFEEAKKLVPLKDNNVATFEVVTNDDMGNDKRSDKTVDSLHKE